MQEKTKGDNSRDEFTISLLKHASRVLGVSYTNDATHTEGISTSAQFAKIKAEICSRERVLGVNNMSLIPLLIKAGDLASNRDLSLGYYHQACDVTDANRQSESRSSEQSDLCVSSYADLGSRLYHHFEYNMAEKIFTAAASICRERAAKLSGASASSDAMALDSHCAQRLHGVLRDCRGIVESTHHDISVLFDGTTLPSVSSIMPRVKRRDFAAQTEAVTARLPLSLPQQSGVEGRPSHMKGLRSARDLEKLVEYVFNADNVRESVATQRLARERCGTTLASDGFPTTPMEALQESIERVTKASDISVTNANISFAGVARKIL